MTKLHKSALSILCGICSITLASSTLAGGTILAPANSGLYLGAFGGWGSLNDFQVRQSGIAMFSPSLNAQGIGGLSEPLAIDATGNVGNNSIGFGGIHIGHQWTLPMGNWSLIPAVELEGFYFGNTFDADLDNSSIVLTEHDFDASFPASAGVVLVNGVFELDAWRMGAFRPYIGIGIGAAIVSITGADSPQVNPPEPNVNHFNSDEDSLDWTFAAQAKAGLRFALSDHCQLFAEYRFIYLGDTEYTFGSTNYPTHVPTTSWNVNFDNMYANAGALGIEFKI